ncbi:GHMP kinase [candidate division NPL-UPA2 bacterium]|nr:GHMP kinase [candidate division NPL-UPA2 bacterium]
MIISANAPTRIDLAGGALDVLPLYLFEPGGPTVNIAINLLTRVRIEARENEEIHLHSIDLNIREEYKDIDSLNLESELGFIARIIKFYRPKVGLNVTTEIGIPKGSGLGTSSSLLISLSGALNELNKTGFTPEQLIDWGANIEAQSIKVLTGKQDYFAAMYGGINAIWSDVKGSRTEKIELPEEVIERLNESIILFFTGEPRFSGATNWALVKGYIDDIGDTRKFLKKLRDSGIRMRECLLAQDLKRFTQLLNEEWEIRKNIAEGVTNPHIEEIIAEAKKAGALASKLCGAGGGGCMITYAEPENRDKVIKSLEAKGAKYMEFKIARKGLSVSQK